MSRSAVNLDAFIAGGEPPRRDERLILELLELIATATASGQSIDARELAPSGQKAARVKRHVRMLRDEQLIRFIDTSDLQDRDSMRIQDLTSAGWSRLEELRQRFRSPVRHWLAKNYPWILSLVGILVAVAGWFVAG